MVTEKLEPHDLNVLVLWVMLLEVPLNLIIEFLCSQMKTHLPAYLLTLYF